MTDVGFASLDVMPVLGKGAAAQINRQLTASLSTAGREAGLTAGRQAGAGITTGVGRAAKESGGLLREIEKGAAVSGSGYGKRFGAAMHESIGEYAKSVGAMMVGFFAFEKVKEVFHDVVEEGRAAAQQSRLTEAVLGSTGGVAGVTASHVEELASSLGHLAGIDDDTIHAGENLLLTFQNVHNEVGKGNDIFDQGAKAALNMSSALSLGLSSSVRLVGRALNDPVKGLTMLTRVGVTYTAQQQAQIKTMVESNHLIDAQKIVLGGLAQRYDGAAAAMRDPMKAAQADIKNVEEEIGQKLMPILGRLSLEGTQGIVGLTDGIGAIPGPVKTAAGAWVAYSLAQKLAGTSSVFMLRLRTSVAVDAIAASTRGAAAAYRTASAAELEMGAGATRTSAQLAGLRAASISAGAAAGGALTRGLSGVMGMVGGPWGAAMIAGTVVATHFWQAHQEAKAATESFTAALNQQTGALTENNRVMAVKALQDSGALSAAKAMGIGLDLVTQAALGNTSAWKQVDLAIKNYTNNGGDINNAGKLETAISSQNKQVAGSKQAWEQQHEALSGVASATEGVTRATEQGTKATESATSALKAHVEALNKDADAALKGRQDRLALIEQMQATAAQAGKGTKAFDLVSKAGQENRKSLYDLAQQWDGTAARVQNSSGTYAHMRAEFVKDATQMGATRAQAKSLADQLLHIPDAHAKVTVDGVAVSMAQIKTLRQGLSAVNGFAAHAMVDITSIFGGGGKKQHKAGGGLLRGPGTSTSDSIPLMGSAGEYMVQAAAVKKYGVGTFDALNAQRLASGGPVGKRNVLTTSELSSASHSFNLTPSMAVAQANKAIAQFAYTVQRDGGHLGKGLEGLTGKVDKTATRLGVLGTRLGDIRSAQSSAQSSALGAFNHDPFSGSLSDFVTQASADRNDANAMKAAIKKAEHKGLDGLLGANLEASGNLALAQQFAGASKAQIRNYEKLYSQQQHSATSVGNQAAAFMGPEIKALTTHMKHQTQVLNRLEKAIEHLPHAVRDGTAKGVQGKAKTAAARRRT